MRQIAEELGRGNSVAPLYILSVSPYAPADALSALLNFSMEAVFCIDSQQKAALDYGKEYNVIMLVDWLQ